MSVEPILKSILDLELFWSVLGNSVKWHICMQFIVCELLEEFP
jgi:hypothetical protein